MRKIAILLCMLPLAARADDLGKARKYLKQMQYRQAWKMAVKAERSETSGPEQLIEAYRLQGLAQAAMGKGKRATQAFRKLLAIQPDFRLPDSVSPKLMPPFEQAVTAAAQKQKPIRLEHAPPNAGDWWQCRDATRLPKRQRQRIQVDRRLAARCLASTWAVPDASALRGTRKWKKHGRSDDSKPCRPQLRAAQI